MATGDCYKKRLKAETASLGTGTADTTTYLRGDGTWVNPASVSDISNLQSTLVMLVWDTYSDDRAFDDIATDNFGDTTGIDTGSSSGYTASAGYIQPLENEDISLVSQSWESSANDPTSAFILLNIEPIDSITLDEDLKAYVSIDDGSHYEQVTGLEIIREIGDYDFIRGDIYTITARADKTIRIKITGHNNSSNTKQFKIHSWAIGVNH